MCLNDLTAETAQVATGRGERGDSGHYSREIRVVKRKKRVVRKKERESGKPEGQKGYKAYFQLNWQKVKACQSNNCSKTEIVRHC